MADHASATHVYCGNCAAIEPAIFDPLNGLDASGQYAGWDIVCERCKLVVSTIWKAALHPGCKIGRVVPKTFIHDRDHQHTA